MNNNCNTHSDSDKQTVSPNSIPYPNMDISVKHLTGNSYKQTMNNPLREQQKCGDNTRIQQRQEASCIHPAHLKINPPGPVHVSSDMEVIADPNETRNWKEGTITSKPVNGSYKVKIKSNQ